MSTLSLRIHGRDHTLACGDGEEDRLRQLASELEKRLALFDPSGQRADDPTLLLTAGVSLADDLLDARQHIAELQEELKHKRQAEKKKLLEMERSVTTTIEDIAARIERIAAEVEKR